MDVQELRERLEYYLEMVGENDTPNLFEPFLDWLENQEPSDDWPTFQVSEIVQVKGCPFKVQRINASSIVLRPDVQGVMSARRAVNKMRA